MKNHNFHIDGRGRINPFVDADGYSDEPPGGEPVGELVTIADFLPPPSQLGFKFRIVSDEQAAREDAELGRLTFSP